MWLWKKIKSRKKCFADTYSKVIPITPTKKEKWKKKFTTAYITGEVHGLRLCPSCHKWNVLLHSVKQMLNLSQQNEQTASRFSEKWKHLKNRTAPQARTAQALRMPWNEGESRGSRPLAPSWSRTSRNGTRAPNRHCCPAFPLTPRSGVSLREYDLLYPRTLHVCVSCGPLTENLGV